MHPSLSALLVWCSKLSAFFRESPHLHTARFASLHELTELLSTTLDETSLLLGSGQFHQLLAVRPTTTRRELGNLLVVAPTRGGKGLLAISQLLSWQHSAIVNDVKGELFAQTAGYRATLGKVYVIDPTGVGHCYDPTAGKHTDLELKAIAKGLLYKPEEGDGEIFTQRAIRMLIPILHAARHETIPLLPYAGHLMNEPIHDVAKRLNSLDPKLATRFLDGLLEETDFHDKFLHSAWGTLTARLDALLSDSVAQCFTGSDFTAQDIMRSHTPVTVYLRWKERDLLALSPLVRLIWGSLIDELITTYDSTGGQNCHPVLLLIDEAGRTAIPSLAEHATTVVGRGISLWIAIQSLSQLDVVYGRERATVLRDNCETQVFYRPASQETATYLEDCLGRKSDYAHSQTLREGAETSEGRSEQGIPLLTAWEIKQLPHEDIISFHRQLPPFRAKRMDWRRYPLLRERQAIPPPKLSPLPTRDLALPLLGQVVNSFPTGFIDPDALLDPDAIGVDPDLIGVDPDL
jgi:type IV secretion system protein VirD4